jgi:hypothetical protein
MIEMDVTKIWYGQYKKYIQTRCKHKKMDKPSTPNKG